LAWKAADDNVHAIIVYGLKLRDIADDARMREPCAQHGLRVRIYFARPFHAESGPFEP
jgi:hypothetical protein